MRIAILAVLLIAAHTTSVHALWEVTTLTYTGSTGNYGDYDTAISGDYIFVDEVAHSSSTGAVLVWKLDGNSVWQEHQRLVPTVPLASALFGSCIAASDSHVVIGAQGASSSKGIAYVFELNTGNGNWEQLQILDPPDTSSSSFGAMCGIDGDLIAVGGYSHSGSAGGVWPFYYSSGSGEFELENTQVGAGGSSLGSCIGVSGSRIIAGATGSNSATVYTRTGVNTFTTATLTPTGAVGSGQFGYSCSISGDTAIVGARLDDTNKGAAYIFEFSTSWLQVEKMVSDQTGQGYCGWGTDIEGSLAMMSCRSAYSAAIYYEQSAPGSWSRIQTVQSSLSDPRTADISRDGFSVTSHFVVASPSIGLPTSNPLRCGEYDEDNSRYFYNDGTGCETTPTTADACYYTAGDLVTTTPASLRDDLSELKADGGEDYIYLAFDLPDKYYNHEMLFADAATGECAYAEWEEVSATRDVDPLSSCFTTFVYRLPWTDAYNATSPRCGWERDTSGANVKLVLDFAVRATEDLSTMRNGTTIRRTSEFSMPVQVEFPVQVTAQTENIQVFSEVRVIAAIIGQAVTIDESTNPDTATLTLRLSTEVQNPFELHAITSVSHPGDVTLASTLDGNNDATIRKDAECTNSALDCGNEWEWTYTTQTTTEPCDFDGAYSVSFTVRCSDVGDTNCPIDSSTDSVTISFTVDSSDHCPKVIDSIVLSADLNVFDAPQRVTAADDFVGDGLQDDGQTAVNEGDADQWQVAYFTAPTTSTQVALDTTEFNQVWIIRGDASKVVLLDKDNVHGTGAIACTATAYADADNTASCGTEAGLDTTTCQLIVPDIAFPDKCGAFDFAHRPGTAADAGSSSTPWFEFDINTGASGFNMDDDAIETMTIHAVIDVTYTNAAKRTSISTQETRADFATVAAPLNAGTATGTSTSSSTGTSSSALFGMNATVLYGAGAGLVLAVLAVLVVVSRRRSSSKMEKIQSTAELTTTV